MQTVGQGTPYILRPLPNLGLRLPVPVYPRFLPALCVVSPCVCWVLRGGNGAKAWRMEGFGVALGGFVADKWSKKP